MSYFETNLTMNFDLSTIAAIFGIIATLITGAVWVMSLVNKVTTKVVSQEKDLTVLKQDIDNLKKVVDNHESKNSYFRHNFDPVTKSIFNKIDNLEETIKSSIQQGFANIKELFDEKIKNVNDRINQKKQS